MADTSKPGDKELFIGSELRPKVEFEQSKDAPQVDSLATNQEIQEAALKALENDESTSALSEDYGDWQSQKDCVLHAAEDVHCTILEGDAVLLNLDNGHYYSLNKVGTAIWEYCDGIRSLQDVLKHICDRFEVGEERARADLLSISSQLVKEQLLLNPET
jgi:hypothetical protein